MGVTVGLLSCAAASVLFGTTFVPIKTFSPGNGIFAQWVMSIAVLLVGLIVYAIEGFPKFEPLAMLGGALWAIGNAMAVPIMNTIGIGLGMLIWGTTNCIAGWASGRFGLFGLKPAVPASPLLNYLGLVLVVVGGSVFSQIKASPASTSPYDEIDQEDEEEHERSPLLSREPSRENILPRTDFTSMATKRNFAVITSLITGVLYGLTFVPVIYIQDNPEKFPGAPTNGLSFVFSHYTGIFATATIIMFVYVAFAQNDPIASNNIIGPSFVGGLMWGSAQSFWFVANDNLSQAVSFPIITMVPGVIATFWSVFYFREIRGDRNLKLLSIAIATTMFGAVLVGISK